MESQERVLKLDRGVDALGEEVFEEQNDVSEEEEELSTSELDFFVFSTLRSLIQKEENLLGQRSSLRVFARLDVGVMEDDTGRASFFVSEVERIPTACVFKDDYHIGQLALAMKRHLIA
jgi:hypothetical protein